MPFKKNVLKAITRMHSSSMRTNHCSNASENITFPCGGKKFIRIKIIKESIVDDEARLGQLRAVRLGRQ